MSADGIEFSNQAMYSVPAPHGGDTFHLLGAGAGAAGQGAPQADVVGTTEGRDVVSAADASAPAPAPTQPVELEPVRGRTSWTRAMPIGQRVL